MHRGFRSLPSPSRKIQNIALFSVVKPFKAVPHLPMLAPLFSTEIYNPPLMTVPGGRVLRGFNIPPPLSLEGRQIYLEVSKHVVDIDR